MAVRLAACRTSDRSMEFGTEPDIYMFQIIWKTKMDIWPCGFAPQA